MGSLNEITSDFEIDILFTQLWRDESLSFSHMLACKSHVCSNEYGRPTLNGTLWINHRLSVKSPCNLDLRQFPFDVQSCILILESYSHNAEENGTLWINHRLSVKSPCNLDLRQFPFDVQSCILILESYSHNAEEKHAKSLGAATVDGRSCNVDETHSATRL
ncbi:unnamed protein product [Strongylus vulgaris]|uniref:Neurotransmitter-gated ion-channel ligand-binding domain-containing protein n=1 Tax=Strongylus vulgaris TaxID=40348 RepID=A0A3P7J8U5_STRVU|nr:unnamed protein product [Strongylus vulgaris]